MILAFSTISTGRLHAEAISTPSHSGNEAVHIGKRDDSNERPTYDDVLNLKNTTSRFHKATCKRTCKHGHKRKRFRWLHQ